MAIFPSFAATWFFLLLSSHIIYVIYGDGKNSAHKNKTNERAKKIKQQLRKPHKHKHTKDVSEMYTQAMNYILFNAFLFNFFLRRSMAFYILFLWSSPFFGGFHVDALILFGVAFVSELLVIIFFDVSQMQATFDFNPSRKLSYLPFVTFAHFSCSLFYFDIWYHFSIHFSSLVTFAHFHFEQPTAMKLQSKYTIRKTESQKVERLDYLYEQY